MSIRFLFNTSRRLVKPLLGVAVAAAVMQAPAIASAADNPFVLLTDPAITPAFNPDVHNYAMKCTGGSVDILTSGPTSYVAGKEYHGTNTVTVPVLPGQQVVVAQPDQRSYHLRCIPDDFPAYTSTVSGPVQSRGFLVQPNIIIGSTTNQPYTVVFDRFGVPVWWYRDADNAQPLDAKFLDATTVAWNVAGIEYVRDLFGNVVKTFTGPDDGLDNHDFIKMPDGNFLGLEYLHRDCLSTPSECVDLSSWGDSDQSAIIDAKIIEFAPDGTVLWSWRAADHIDVAIENANWHYGNHDIVHMNSLEYDGNGGIIFSARHLDAVYRIDMTSGDVTWKLGGTTTPESLTVVGPKGLSTFSGQHFARRLPDGTLTVHDNRTKKGKSPRAIRFSIDPGAKTATVVSWISDPRVPDSICCGNAYLLPTGNWVAAWGASNAVTELMPSAQPTITIDFQTMFTYRVAPVLATIRSLRQAMNITYASNP